MPPVQAWIIFYTDRSTFSSDDGDPADAPGWDVQAIACNDAQVGHVVSERDYYWIEDGQWTGGDFASLLQWLVGQGVLKVGRYTSNARWDEITKQAHRSLDRKSAWRPDERRA